MTFGPFSAAHDAVGQFIANELMSTALSTGAPSLVNILDSFNHFLQRHGFNPLRASEEAQKQESLILRHLENELQEWHILGVPAPISYIEDNNRIIITWKHRLFRHRHFDTTEFNTENFVAIYDWISALHDRDLLFACIVLLKLLKCNPIYVSDGSGDMGVDCIGKISTGSLQSAVILVQAKSLRNPARRITENVLRQEYAKYAMLKRTDKYLEYLNKLAVFQGRDGSAELYLVVTNSEFSSDAQRAASKLGILLRSKRQVAFYLALSTTIEAIRELCEDCQLPAGPDMDRNLAEEIRLGSTSHYTDR